MEFRCIGPYRGGRSIAVTGVRHDPLTFYFGGTGGGVWKTADGGSNWEQRLGQGLQDGIGRGDRGLGVGSERRLRRDGGGGDPGQRVARRRRLEVHGRRADLEEHGAEGARGRSRGSGSIRPIPTSSTSRRWATCGGRNAERGIFRSQDGGKTWTKVLFVDEKTGASDLSMDPSNPRVLYAAFWQVVRRPWELVSGGPGSSLYKSTDGGDTWKKLTREDNEGLPEGIWGRSASRPRRARPAASTRSSRRRREASSSATTAARNGSTSTTSTRSASAPGTTRGSIADPKNADTLYLPSVYMHKSTDGGKTLRQPLGPARRQPRPLDRPGRSEADDPRQRRRRDDHLQRRQDLVHAEQPADGAVLPRRDGQPVSRTGSTARSRTTRASGSRRA